MSFYDANGKYHIVGLQPVIILMKDGSDSVEGLFNTLEKFDYFLNAMRMTADHKDYYKDYFFRICPMNYMADMLHNTSTGRIYFRLDKYLSEPEKIKKSIQEIGFHEIESLLIKQTD